MNDSRFRAVRKSGWYEYRGFRIQDHGGGLSVNAALNRGASRWKIWRIVHTGFFQSEYVGGAPTLRAAKERVDGFVEEERAQ